MRYFRKKPLSKIEFSEREKECMTCFLQGYSIAKTGHILGLSPRTVEYYSNNMKRKVGCRTKAELIEIVIKTNKLIKKTNFLKDEAAEYKIEPNITLDFSKLFSDPFTS